jgi:hypothetical protein
VGSDCQAKLGKGSRLPAFRPDKRACHPEPLGPAPLLGPCSKDKSLESGLTRLAMATISKRNEMKLR